MWTGSHLNAQFKGKNKAEFGWFAVSGQIRWRLFGQTRGGKDCERNLR